MPAKKVNKLEKRIVLQLVSVFTAVALWFIISYTENPTLNIDLKKIKIEYSGIEELEARGLTVSPTNKVPAFSVRVSGKRSALLSVINKTTAYVDVSRIDTVGSYALEIKADIPSTAVTQISQKFKKLDVVVEPITEKTVPVVVRHTDKNKDYLVKSTPQKNEITIRGAESVIETASLAEIAFGVLNMTSDNEQEYGYRIMDTNNNEIDAANGIRAYEAAVLVKNELYKSKVMGIDVRLSEAEEALYDVDVIQTSDVQAGVRDGAAEILTAHIPEGTVLRAGIGDYKVNIDDMENIYVEKQDVEQLVRLNVLKKELRYVHIPVRIDNVAPELNAWCDTAAVDAYISCVPAKFETAVLEAYADVGGMKAGTHEVTLKFAQNDGVTISEQYKVKVTLSAK